MKRKAMHSFARWLLLPLLLTLLAGCGADPATQGSTEPDKSRSQAESKGGEQTGATGSKSGEKQPEKKDVVLKQVYTDETLGLTVRTPIYWEGVRKDGAVVVLFSPQNGPEDLYRENVMITADDQFKDLTLVTYLKALAIEVRKRYPDTETLESGEFEIDGIMAHWLVDSFNLPNSGPAKVYRVVLVREQTAYVYHGTAPVPTFDLYRPTFEAIARSTAWPKPDPKQ